MVTPNLNAILDQTTLRLPPHDYEVFTYVAAGAANDDKVTTVTGYRGGSTGTAVGVLTFTYVGATNNVATVSLTLPTANG